MIDPKHPLIRRLLDDGYRIAYHEHLRGDRVISSFDAWKKNPPEKHSGRSAIGSPIKALEDLGERMGIEDLA